MSEPNIQWGQSRITVLEAELAAQREECEMFENANIEAGGVIADLESQLFRIKAGIKDHVDWASDFEGS